MRERFKLPKGVPASNREAPVAARFVAPDASTPVFARNGQNRAPGGGAHEAAFHETEKPFEASSEDDDDRNKPARRHRRQNLLIDAAGWPSPAMAAVAVLAVVGAVGAVLIANSRPSTPLCADQPEWNQYNCRQE